MRAIAVAAIGTHAQQAGHDLGWAADCQKRAGSGASDWIAQKEIGLWILDEAMEIPQVATWEQDGEGVSARTWRSVEHDAARAATPTGQIE